MTARDVDEFFAALSRGEIDPIAERLAEDVVLEFPGRRFGGRFEGKRRVAVFLKRNQRLFEGGLRFTVHWVGLTDDRAVAQWTNAGTTRTGVSYANRGVTVFVLENGLISRIHDYLDTETIAETWPE